MASAPCVRKISQIMCTNIHNIQRCMLSRIANNSVLKNRPAVPMQSCLAQVTREQFSPMILTRSLHRKRRSSRTQDFSVAVNLQEQDVSQAGKESDVLGRINTSISMDDTGRLFAVIQVAGRQKRVTTEDVIVVEGNFSPNIGDRIKLEKVLMVGGRDFTMFGKPLLSREIVNVEATVVEKTLSQDKVWFVYLRRKNFRKLKLHKYHYTMLVINSIEVQPVQQ